MTGKHAHGRSSRTNVIVATAACLLGVFFLASGLRKLYGWEWALETYRAHHPLWVYYTSAVVEVVTGIGLLFGRARFWASTGQLALIFWVTFWPVRALDPQTAVPFAVTSLLLFCIAAMTLPRPEQRTGTRPTLE
ncbi:MauE/DoxX family redox-associated membrane protein [Actinomadura rupiterrae]|uniref:MauE/DoxX family redox-associated membrane protein n=1 Tax=Actinomadura rupiterrae TaxID=559627 RepID=UPI0020A25F71|nr:DoxX family membrane protein [Actinomadura rupiterrae]MCP2342085.1 putative membrane protein YphA (DoxX/SURF4 family) [Actinomadura rupiterrae]